MTPTRRYRDEPDVILVAAAQRGEKNALDALLRRHYPTVVSRCRRVLNNDADANDAAQNALIAVAKGIGRFDGTSSFTTWLYRVATNAALDEVRRRNRRPEPRLSANDQTPPADSAVRTTVTAMSIDPAAEARIESVADRDAIHAALEHIPPEFRAPLVLRDLCGLDYAEIAEVLAIPPGTVRSRIARGRAALAPHLRTALADHAATDQPRSATTGEAKSLDVTTFMCVVERQEPSVGNFFPDGRRQRFHDGH